MTVNGHHPLSEAIARMLFGVENVPPATARKMVSDVSIMAGEYVAEIEDDRDRLREALDHALKGDMDPEDRVIIAQILDGKSTTGGKR